MKLRRAAVVFAFSAASALMLAMPPARAAGPSFDCAKAATPIERAICGDATLGDLDAQLAAAQRATIAADPARRDAMLAAARDWLVLRNRECAAAEVACLTRVYRARLDALAKGATPTTPIASSAPAAGALVAPGAVCNRFVDLYRKWLGSVAPSNPTATADGPLAMADAQGSEVMLAKPVLELPSKGSGKLQDWAAAQKPPVQLPKAALDLAGAEMMDAVTLDQAPGRSYFVVSGVAGTAHCRTSSSFSIVDGVAKTVAPPPNWPEGQGEGCGVTRGFVKIDETAIAFDDSTSYGPDLSANLSLSPWNGTGFGKACTIRFDYAPGYSTEHLFNDWDVKCAGPRCPALKRAAIDIAKDAKKDWRGATARALARLSPQDRARFSADDLASRRESKDEPTDQNPLVLLMMIDGQPYRVEVGHFTIGWRTFGDWSVKFFGADGSDAGSFGVGMGRGALTKATVK